MGKPSDGVPLTNGGKVKLIGVEAQIVFWAACFFTFLYLWQKEFIFGITTFSCWFTLGFLWLFLAKEAPSYDAYAVALLFHGIGILFLIITVVDLLYRLTLEKKGLGGEL